MFSAYQTLFLWFFPLFLFLFEQYCLSWSEAGSYLTGTCHLFKVEVYASECFRALYSCDLFFIYLGWYIKIYSNRESCGTIGRPHRGKFIQNLHFDLIKYSKTFYIFYIIYSQIDIILKFYNLSTFTRKHVAGFEKFTCILFRPLLFKWSYL